MQIEMMSRNTAAQSGPSTPATNSNNKAIQQASPKVQGSDSHMRKPQPSLMKGTGQNQQDSSQQMQVAPRPLSTQGIMPQTPDGGMMSTGVMNPQQARSMTSPHMIANQQYNSPGVGMNQPRSQPLQQTSMLSPGQSMVIGGSPPPVNAANQGSNMNQSLRQVLHILKSDNTVGPSSARGNTPGGSEQLIELLKTNPQLMSTIVKQRKQQAQNNRQQQAAKQNQFTTQVQGNMPTSMGNVQQQPMQQGMQQVALQTAMNQPGINMQPMQVTNTNMQQQMHWQQQRRMQLQQQQNQFQAPAPEYPQLRRSTRNRRRLRRFIEEC